MKRATGMPQPAYLTAAEAAAELRVSRTTIWRWIGEGRLRAYRAGGRTVRIRREDLRAALEPVRRTKEKEQPIMKDRVEVGVAEGDIWADYDPARVRAALRQSSGALAGIDRSALLEEIRKQRKQDTKGRPA